MNNKELQKSNICLNCPRGCNKEAKLCPMGVTFFQQEAKEPLRHYFSSYRDRNNNLCAYRTSHPVSMKIIEEHCNNLLLAKDAHARNEVHIQFINRHKVQITKSLDNASTMND